MVGRDRVCGASRRPGYDSGLGRWSRGVRKKCGFEKRKRHFTKNQAEPTYQETRADPDKNNPTSCNYKTRLLPLVTRVTAPPPSCTCQGGCHHPRVAGEKSGPWGVPVTSGSSGRWTRKVASGTGTRPGAREAWVFLHCLHWKKSAVNVANLL